MCSWRSWACRPRTPESYEAIQARVEEIDEGERIEFVVIRDGERVVLARADSSAVSSGRLGPALHESVQDSFAGGRSSTASASAPGRPNQPRRFSGFRTDRIRPDAGALKPCEHGILRFGEAIERSLRRHLAALTS